MNSVFGNPELWKNAKGGGPSPEAFMGIFKWMYLVFLLFALGLGVGNFLSGRYLAQKKNALFSTVMAGINCLYFPLGTPLGVFTFIVLFRRSVSELYKKNALKNDS